MIDAAQSGEIKQRGQVVSDYVLDIFPFPFRRDACRFDPLRQALRHVFLKKRLPLDSVRIAAQNQRTVLEKRQQIIRDPIVVGHQIAFGVAGFGKEDLVEMSEPETLSCKIKRNRLLLSGEKLRLDFLLLT